MLPRWQQLLKAHLPGVLRRTSAFPSCSVVGSSGVMVHQKHGKEIDAADAVFRINDAPITGYEAFVGSKTTFRVWAGGYRRQRSRINGTREEAEGVPLAFCQPAAWVGKCWGSIVNSSSEPRLSPLLWQQLWTDIRRTVSWHKSKKKYPSTGAVTIGLALRMCRHVRIFGFGNDSWNCPLADRPVCGKYMAARLTQGLDAEGRPQECGLWGVFSSMEVYRKQDGPGIHYHNFPLEWDWLAHLLRQGAVKGPSCSQVRL